MQRAVSSVLGVLLLTALTLVFAAVAGVAVMTTAPTADAPEPVVISASADADTGWIVLVHESGADLDVGTIVVRISIDGVRLEHQPPVPFRGSTGFWGAPVGPFNDATDPAWDVGESAGVRLASSNEPDLSSGATVRIELYRDGLPIASVETTAR